MSKYSETPEEKAERIASQSLQKEGTFIVELESVKENEDKNYIPFTQIRYTISEGEDAGKGFTDNLYFFSSEEAKFDDNKRKRRAIALGVKDDFETVFGATITDAKSWDALKGKPFLVDRVKTQGKPNPANPDAEPRSFYNTKNIRKIPDSSIPL